MKTQGEIEAAVCQGIAQFELKYMGRGPQDIQAFLIRDLMVIRLRGVLTAAERHLVTAMPSERGRELLKQVREQLIEQARPDLETLIYEITGVKSVSLHYDISTVTGEAIVVFSLTGVPQVREARRMNGPANMVDPETATVIASEIAEVDDGVPDRIRFRIESQVHAD